MTLESVSVVQEFSDVFRKDLPRLPLDKELKFGNDLLPKSTPISILLYRMTSVELKELMTHGLLANKSFMHERHLAFEK